LIDRICQLDTVKLQLQPSVCDGRTEIPVVSLGNKVSAVTHTTPACTRQGVAKLKQHCGRFWYALDTYFVSGRLHQMYTGGQRRTETETDRQTRWQAA